MLWLNIASHFILVLAWCIISHLAKNDFILGLQRMCRLLPSFLTCLPKIWSKRGPCCLCCGDWPCCILNKCGLGIEVKKGERIFTWCSRKQKSRLTNLKRKVNPRSKNPGSRSLGTSCGVKRRKKGCKSFLSCISGDQWILFTILMKW